MLKIGSLFFTKVGIPYLFYNKGLITDIITGIYNLYTKRPVSTPRLFITETIGMKICDEPFIKHIVYTLSDSEKRLDVMGLDSLALRMLKRPYWTCFSNMISLILKLTMLRGKEQILRMAKSKIERVRLRKVSRACHHVSIIKQ